MTTSSGSKVDPAIRRAWDFCDEEHGWDNPCPRCQSLADAFRTFSAEALQKETPLHAAAPEMLALLQACRAYFDDMANGMVKGVSGKWFQPDEEWLAPLDALLARVGERT